MSLKSGFDLHPGAAEDFLEIWEFTAQDNIRAARRVRLEILDAIISLVAFPNQGHRRPNLTQRPLRFQNVRDYLIAYAPDEKPLLVIAILHGRRNPDAIRAILQQRQ